MLLLSGLALAIAAYAWYKLYPGAQDVLSSASTSDSGVTSGGGVIEAITQLPEQAVGVLDRGFRDNNPGNIRPAGQNFQGLTGTDAQGFGIFSSMEDGLRAIAVIIKNYYLLHGLNTVDGIIRRWSATDQDAYVTNVAAVLGVDPHEDIDPTDPNTLQGIVEGIITQENGRVLAATITTAQIENGVALA